MKLIRWYWPSKFHILFAIPLLLYIFFKKDKTNVIHKISSATHPTVYISGFRKTLRIGLKRWICLSIGRKSVFKQKCQSFSGSSFYNVRICYFSLFHTVIVTRIYLCFEDIILGSGQLRCTFFHNFMIFYRPNNKLNKKRKETFWGIS